MNKLVLTIFSFWLCLPLVLGQDAYFSNMESAPTFLNPAMTGAMQGNIRLITKYRSQWDRVLGDLAYKNKLAALDFRQCLDFGNRREAYIAGGVYFQRESAGASQFYTQNLGLSLAYHHQLDKSLYLAVGTNLGLFNYGLDVNALTFDEQFDALIGFNRDLPSLENFAALKLGLFKLDMGLTLYDAEENWTFGAALFQINQPTFSFQNIEDGNRLDMGFVFHGTKAFSIYDSKQLLLRIIYRKQALFNTKNHWQLITGVVFNFNHDNRSYSNSKFYRSEWQFLLGLSSRIAGNEPHGLVTFDAVIPSFSIEKDAIKVQLSYDINVSQLARRNNFFNGGFEATVIVQFKKKASCLICPPF